MDAGSIPVAPTNRPYYVDKRGKRMCSIREVILETAKGSFEIGMMDEKTYKEFEEILNEDTTEQHKL